MVTATAACIYAVWFAFNGTEMVATVDRHLQPDVALEPTPVFFGAAALLAIPHAAVTVLAARRDVPGVVMVSAAMLVLSAAASMSVGPWAAVAGGMVFVAALLMWAASRRPANGLRP